MVKVFDKGKFNKGRLDVMEMLEGYIQGCCYILLPGKEFSTCDNYPSVSLTVILYTVYIIIQCRMYSLHPFLFIWRDHFTSCPMLPTPCETCQAYTAPSYPFCCYFIPHTSSLYITLYTTTSTTPTITTAAPATSIVELQHLVLSLSPCTSTPVWALSSDSHIKALIHISIIWKNMVLNLPTLFVVLWNVLRFIEKRTCVLLSHISIIFKRIFSFKCKKNYLPQ